MSDDFIDERLGHWMRPVTTDLDNERLEVLRAASKSAAKVLEGRELDSVLAAHGELNEETRGWLGSQLRAADESFVAEGKDELLRTLAGVAVLRGISRDGASAALCALSASSAEFTGMEPTIAELPGMARLRLAEMGRQTRERGSDEVPSFSTKVPPQREETNEAGEPIPTKDILEDIYALGQAIKKLASGIGSTMKPVVSRQGALDEEVEMLWWVISDADETGMPWTERNGISRAVAGAAELAKRTKTLPGPPSAGALLEKLLGKDSAKEKALSEIAKEAAGQQIDGFLGHEHPLLPIASACELIGKFATEEDEETWQKAMKIQLKLDPKQKHPLSAVAMQLYRELQIIRLDSA